MRGPALAIARSHYGEEHVLYEQALFKAAVEYRFLEQYDKAEPLFQQVQKMLEKSPHDPMHRDTPYLVHVFLGQIYLEQKRWPQCLEQFDLAVRTNREFVMRRMAIEEELHPYFLLMLRTELVWPLGVAWFHRTDQEFVDRAAEWVLNIQGLNVELTADRALSLRDGNDPRARQLAAKLIDHVEQMHFSAEPLPGPQFSEATAARWAEELRLHAELQQWLQKHQRPHEWLKLDDIRAALPENSVLVLTRRQEWLAYEIKQLAGQRFYAVVIPPRGKGNVELKIIGPAEQYEQEIKQFDAQYQQIGNLPPGADWKAVEAEELRTPVRSFLRSSSPASERMSAG